MIANFHQMLQVAVCKEGSRMKVIKIMDIQIKYFSYASSDQICNRYQIFHQTTEAQLQCLYSRLKTSVSCQDASESFYRDCQYTLFTSDMIRQFLVARLVTVFYIYLRMNDIKDDRLADCFISLYEISKKIYGRHPTIL